MLRFIAPSARRVLDVGCSTGRFGAALRDHYPEMEVWGIDPTPHPSDRPQPYATRLVGEFPADVPSSEKFDCIVFNDVLEHLVDPWSALRQAHAHLTSRAEVVVSVPNVRHVWVLRPLLLEGRWDYQDEGILDRTHLRFFTRSTAIELLETTGYVVREVHGIEWEDDARTQGRLGLVNRILRGRLDDLFAQQFALVARPIEPADADSPRHPG
jgi:SAM-dependent methyltransferase